MKLYGALLSPYVRKVALVLEEKGIAWELALSNPGSPDPDFQEASPFGKIPAIVDDDYKLADSSAIVAYLDAKQPGPAMLPAEARARGRAMWFDEFADTIYCASCNKILFNRLVGPKLLKLPASEEIALEGEAELPRILDYLESVAPSEGWLAGDFTLGDIAVASVMRSLTYVGHGPDADRYPRTAGWYDRVTARPSWTAIAAMEAPLSERLKAMG
jgi:glutathione S-transferase